MTRTITQLGRAEPDEVQLPERGDMVAISVMLDEPASRGGNLENSGPKAGDLWLRWTVLRRGVTIRPIGIRVRNNFPLMLGMEGNALRHVTVADGGNDACSEKLSTEGGIKTLNRPVAEHQAPLFHR